MYHRYHRWIDFCYYGKWGGTQPLMRVVDFTMILPILDDYQCLHSGSKLHNVPLLVFIMTAFYWVGFCSLFIQNTYSSRSKLDYVMHQHIRFKWLRIMFQKSAKLSSLIIVNLIFTFSREHRGIETGLTYLGSVYHLQQSITWYINFCSENADIIENKLQFGYQPQILILIKMLCINYAGQALQCAADSPTLRLIINLQRDWRKSSLFVQKKLIWKFSRLIEKKSVGFRCLVVK